MGTFRWLLVLGLFVHVVSCSNQAEIPKLVPEMEFVQEKLDEDVPSMDVRVPKVDILFVVDGSGSMSGHQANLEANIDMFVDELAKVSALDYRVAVTVSGCSRMGAMIDQYPNLSSCDNSGVFHTADINDSMPYFVSNFTPDGLDILRNRLLVGSSHDWMETFFGPVLDAIDRATYLPQNLSFFRPGAFFVPIFITDTEDQTYVGNGNSGVDHLDPLDFYNSLLIFKGDAGLIIPYSVHIPVSYGSLPPTGCFRDAGGVNRGVPHRIEQFLDLAGGVFFDLCAPDFGEELAKIGQDLVQRVGSRIYLIEVPDVRTLRVLIGDQEIPNDPLTGWVYDTENNAIVLGREVDLSAYDPSARVRVQYVKANTFRK